MRGDNRGVKSLSQRDWFLSHVALSSLGVGLIALGAIGVGWLPPLYDVTVHPLLEALRRPDEGQVLSRILVIAGGALLLHSWLIQGYVILQQRAISLARMRQLLIVWLLLLIAAPPLFSRDVYSYIAQGRLVVIGLDPYRDTVAQLPGWFQLGADPMWAESPSPYGPVFVFVQYLIAAITPTSPTAAVLLFKLLNVCALLALFAGVVRLAVHHHIDPVAAVWLAVLNPLSIMHFIAGLHNDVIMIAALVWSFVWAFQSRRHLALIALVLAIGIKPIAVLALPFVVLAYLRRNLSSRQVWLHWLGASVIVVALLALLGTWRALGWGWIGGLLSPASVVTLLSPTTALAELVRLLTTPFALNIDVLTEVRLMGLAVAVGIVGFLALTWRTRPVLRGAAIAFTTVVALSPVVQPWYLLWALPLIAGVGLRRSWHLRVIVIVTALMVIFSLAEVSVVADSTIDVSDFLSIAIAALVIIVVALLSPRERELVLGSSFAAGLQPYASDSVVNDSTFKEQHVTP